MLKIFGEGRLVKEASVFTYGNNKSGVNFTLACNRFGYGDNDTTSFIRCTMYGRDENFAQTLHVGNQYIVEGDLIIKPYEEGDNYSGTCNLIVDSLTFGQQKKN